MEENALPGGFGSAVAELLSDHDALEGRRLRRLGLPDAFVEHGAQKQLRIRLGIDKTGIQRTARELLGRAAKADDATGPA